jgi:uncharacterized delta-60 repeat protein
LNISEEETAMARTTFSRRLRRRPRVEILEDRRLLTAGFLDTTFGGTGMVFTPVSSPWGWGLYVNLVAAQSDDKVIAVGSFSKNFGNPGGQIEVARYNVDGSLDSTFGRGGIATIVIKQSLNSDAYAVVIQSDGKIVVAGDNETGNNKSLYDDYLVARLNANGTLDTSFGGGSGYVTTRLAPASGWARVTTMALQPNGQVVVAGLVSIGGGSPYETALVRYNANGSLDTNFGNKGEVIYSGMVVGSPSTSCTGSDLAIDSSGRIDLGGLVPVGSSQQPGVVRYLANGTLDPNFGSSGVAYLASPMTGEKSLALQSTGKIVVCGNGSNGSGDFGAIERLNTDGSLDTSFGTSGVYTDSRLRDFDAMVIQAFDDKIVAVTAFPNTGDYELYVTRVLADGSAYDPSFGTNGLGETVFGKAPYSLASVALDPAGRVLVSGEMGNTIADVGFYTARFQADTSSPNILGTTAAHSGASAAPDPILGALVLSDPTLLDSLPGGKHRHGA